RILSGAIPSGSPSFRRQFIARLASAGSKWNNASSPARDASVLTHTAGVVLETRQASGSRASRLELRRRPAPSQQVPGFQKGKVLVVGAARVEQDVRAAVHDFASRNDVPRVLGHNVERKKIHCAELVLPRPH